MSPGSLCCILLIGCVFGGSEVTARRLLDFDIDKGALNLS